MYPPQDYCYKHEPRPKGKGKVAFEQDEDVQIFLILLKYHFFPFSTALLKQQKILACFPEDKLNAINLIFKFKKFSPPGS